MDPARFAHVRLQPTVRRPQVKLVPCASAAGLKRPGALAAISPELLASQVDDAFSDAVDQQVAELFNS